MLKIPNRVGNDKREVGNDRRGSGYGRKGGCFGVFDGDVLGGIRLPRFARNDMVLLFFAFAL